jgi:hyperosmotically inducible periplasmic protein
MPIGALFQPILLFLVNKESKTMKERITIKCAIVTLALLGMSAAYAQASNAGSTTATATAPASSQSQIRKANRLLSKRVRQTLVKVKGLDSSAIVVIAKGDKITLGGSVPDASQIPLAISAAQGVQGVSEVSNSLRIKQPGE